MAPDSSRPGAPPIPGADVIETTIPARLDALPWGRFHTLVVVALGITWILDGLEVTLAGAVAGALKSPLSLGLTDAQVGLAASAYLLGAVSGALFFGWLTDRLGRKRLFWITLCVYLVGTALTAFSWSFATYAFFRAITGAGIGGEYSAINSAIQELIPARYRGYTDLVINGSFWVGAAAGALGSIVLLDPAFLPPDAGWRVAFGIGAALGCIILVLRGFLPESPRWLMIHGRVRDAEAIVDDIERRVCHAERSAVPPGTRSLAPLGTTPLWTLRVQPRATIGFVDLARTLFQTYPRRALVGLTLMASQAFFYNAIFFTYALVLGVFFGVPAERIGLFLLPLAAGNFLGPLVLGRLFDTIGRRQMIAFTYAASGIALAISTVLFMSGMLEARGQAICWSVVFFFASAAASSGYLTVGEYFPLEVRALSIALFYALGTGIGGIAGPAVFGSLIGTGEREPIATGYVFGASLMIVAAIVASRYGFASERKSLEHVAAPICGVK
jgi:MFS family permease